MSILKTPIAWTRRVDELSAMSDLESNPFFSNIPAEQVDETGKPVTLTKTAHALPQINGSGIERHLRATMRRSGPISTTVFGKMHE